jgi:MFS transporter, DHA1 family, tetracycline resistance protein
MGERRMLIVGMLCGATAFTVYGLASTGVWFWTGIPVMALWGLAAPATLGIMSRLVSPSEQGQLQGANASLMAVAGLLGPAVFTQTFAHSIEPDATLQMPGTPFLLAASLLLAAAAPGGWVTRLNRSAR